MTTIKDVKVWKGRHTKAGRESRIYVHTTDGREGCLYLTGNPWNAKGSITGDLTDKEWQEAREISIWDDKWHTVYQNEIHGDSNARPMPCPDCGGWDCGPNCNANRF